MRFQYHLKEKQKRWEADSHAQVIERFIHFLDKLGASFSFRCYWRKWCLRTSSRQKTEASVLLRGTKN